MIFITDVEYWVNIIHRKLCRRYFETHYFPTFVQIDKNPPVFIIGEQFIHKTKESFDGSIRVIDEFKN